MATGAYAQALENIHRERMGRGSTASQYDEDIVPPVMKRAIAVYEAARVLMGFITPGYDEISQVPQRRFSMPFPPALPLLTWLPQKPTHATGLAHAQRLQTIAGLPGPARTSTQPEWVQVPESYKACAGVHLSRRRSHRLHILHPAGGAPGEPSGHPQLHGGQDGRGPGWQVR